MKITIQREGGFVGMTSKAELDYTKLTDEEQKTIQTFVDKKDDPATDTTKSRGLGQARDAFSYSMSLKKNGKKVSMKFDELNAPKEVIDIFQKYVEFNV